MSHECHECMQFRCECPPKPAMQPTPKERAMNDETKAAVEAVRERAIWTGVVTISVEERAAILAHIDGEPARLAAARTEAADRAWDEAVKATELEQAHVRLRAVAAAREEQREADVRSCSACKGEGFTMQVRECPFCADSTHDHECPTDKVRVNCACGAARIRTTPLDATPLADELRTQREATFQAIDRHQQAHARAEFFKGEMEGLRERAEKAEARVAAQAKEHQDRQALWDEDALFYLQTLRQADRIGELEAERDEAVAALRGAKRWAETDDDSIVEFGEYKRNMEKVDAVLAKYPEGR